MTAPLDPRSDFLDDLVRSLTPLLRNAPGDAAVSIGRDTLRALVGGYKLAVSALDELAAAVRAYIDEAPGPQVDLLMCVLDEHGIELGSAS